MPSVDYLFTLFRRYSPHPSAWLATPVLLYAWTLGGPFLFDDLHLLLKSEAYAEGRSEHLDLFRFAPTDEAWRDLRQRGTYPWWSPEQKRIDFFRPLAEWSFYLDVLLFGRNPAGPRAVSLLLFSAALICVHRLVYVISGPIRAGLVTLFFGISQTLTLPVTFICNRSDLFVIIGVTLAAWAYWSAYARPRWSLIAIALLGFAIALAAKESSVALAGVIFLMEFILKPTSQRSGDVRETSSSRQEKAGFTSQRVIAYVICVMAIVYLAAYGATRHSQLSVNFDSGGPTFTPMSWLAIPLYLSVWVLGFPINLLARAPVWQIYAVTFIAIGVGAFVLRKLWPMIKQDRRAAFFALWAVVFMLPALLVTPETRAISIATLGAIYLISLILVPDNFVAAPRRSVLRHWLLLTNGVGSVACGIATVLVMTQAENNAREKMLQYAQSSGSELKEGDALVITQASSSLEPICAADRLEFLTGKKNIAVTFLAIPGSEIHTRKENSKTIVLDGTAPQLLDTPAHRLTLGTHWKPQLGYKFKLRDLDIQIAKLNDAGQVTRLEARFKKGLGSTCLHFYPQSLELIARQSLPADRDTHSRQLSRASDVD